MSSRRSLVAAVLLAALTAGCALQPLVHAGPAHDVVPEAVLASYRTFAFVDQGTPSASEYASVLTQRLQQSARVALERQGYTYSETAPDLRVNVLVVVDSRAEILDPGFMRRWPYAPEVGTYKHGLLGVDLVDARRSAVVWQGAAHARLYDHVLDDPERAVERAMTQIFANFPKAAAG